jgi:hypothetical protein
LIWSNTFLSCGWHLSDNVNGESNKMARRDRAIVAPPNMVAMFWLELECRMIV